MNRTRTTTRAILVHTDFAPRGEREPYDLPTAAWLAEVHPERVRHYCRLGLVSGTENPDRDPFPFTDQSVFELRRIEYLRREEGVNLRGIRIILDLLRRNESLLETLDFHRQL